ncbi:maltose/glucose-specific PTS transporter subunit IIC [Pantoea anthophila]|uniref:maltose/glucose-specific PTS transporter subunit IIC n=1 Tax=Pantoea anthophila TaxID=470931 RepID=UPI003D770588
MSNIFVPIIPAIVASGLLMGLLGMVKTYGWVNPENALYIMLDMCSSAAFIILPILIGFTAAREFGGNPFLGATLGGILTHPALTNAWGVASGFHTMNFFGFEVAMIGYQGTVFPVLLAVWFMSMLEKQLRRVIPDALDLILTPFLTVILSGFIALLIIGPAGRMLGDGISFVLSTLIAHAGWLAGLVFGGLYSVIVITGVHHSFHAIEAGLLGNPSIGVNFLLPVWAMANVAQGGACLAVWFKTRDAKIKAISLPSAFSALLGITEAAIFGINLRFMKPFIAGLVGGALGGAWVVSVHVYMTAVGLTGLPGMAIVQAGSLLNYIIGIAIAFISAFVISYLLKYKTDAE